MVRALEIFYLMLFFAPIVASQTIYFADKDSVLNHFISDIASNNNLSIDPNKIVAINSDLNADGMKDYWVLYPELQCTSQECWGHVYLKTAIGYCFAGKGMTETDLNFGKKTTFQCN